MRPRPTLDNLTDGGIRNAEVSADGKSTFSVGVCKTDRFDVCGSELGIAVSFTNQANLASLGVSVSSVVLGRSEKQVSRIAARGIVAMMTDAQSLGDGAIGQFPGHAMSASRRVPSPEHSVPLTGRDVRLPWPAHTRSVDSDLTPETFGRTLMDSHFAPPMRVVRDRARTELLTGPVHFTTMRFPPMRKLLLLLLLILAPVAWAQEAALTVPVVREAEAKYTMKRITIEAAEAYFFVSVKDSAGVEIREQVYRVPDSTHPTATIAGIFTAMDTIRAGEVGGQLRKSNFRLLGYLLDNGFLPPVTLTP